MNIVVIIIQLINKHIMIAIMKIGIHIIIIIVIIIIISIIVIIAVALLPRTGRLPARQSKRAKHNHYHLDS